MTGLPTTTTWPAETRQRVAAAILDAALPTCTYRFQMRDGAWAVTPSSEPPAGAEGEQWIYPPNDVLLDFLVERVGPAIPLLFKVLHGIDAEPAAELNFEATSKSPTARKPRKPSMRTLVTQAEKATGKPVQSITLPDGTKLDFERE
jgi:hypothetical protein